MKFRETVIFSGHKFSVPERIQRLDHEHTHGWQLRYGNIPTEFFADGTNDGTGAEASLELAKEALRKRMRRLPAPTGLRTEVASWKTSDLPVGISGPSERKPSGKNKVSHFSFQISVPLPQGGSTTRRAYIGTKNTINQQRIDQALVKAIQIREMAVEKVVQARNRIKRQEANELAPKA